MSTRKSLTPTQRRILDALSARELSNAQVAETARCSEAYASRILSRLAREGLAQSRYAEDAEDPQSHYRMWKKGSGR